MQVEAKQLADWCQSVQVANIIYHRTRNQLWDKLTKIITRRKDPATHVTIDQTLFNSIKSCLTSRSDKLTDDKSLALETAVDQLLDECQKLYDADDDETESEKQEGKKPPQPVIPAHAPDDQGLGL